VDFQPIFLKVGTSTPLGGFSGEGWTPEVDIQAFASILFEIVVGRSVDFETSIPADIPSFVSTIIRSIRRFETRYSFGDVFEILKKNEFRIEDDVDSAEVSQFASWVESAEQSEK
jgi:hypothetical protein